MEIPGAASSQVCYLRTFADSREISRQGSDAQHVVVVGSSFIGWKWPHRCVLAESKLIVVGRKRAHDTSSRGGGRTLHTGAP